MNEGYVYFVETERGDYVKIGWAKDSPHCRMSALQTGCPDLLIMRAYFRGSRQDERRMHDTFAEWRQRGEWFANVLKLSDFLTYLDDTEGARPATEDELVVALADCVLGSQYMPDYPVKESTYDESADWRPWRHLLEKHGMLEDA